MVATLISVAEIYLGIGAVLGVLFLVFLLGRVDRSATGSWAFRPLLLPGLILLWPLVAWRLWRPADHGDPGRQHRPPRRLQGWLGVVLIVSVPVILAIAILIDGPSLIDVPPVRLDPPG